MALTALDVQAFTDEVIAEFIRLRRMVSPEYMGGKILLRLRDQFRDQIQESYAKEGAADGPAWPELSEMRVTVRGSDHPILVDTGDLVDETRRYKGKMRTSEANINYWFPDFREMSGKYWGLTAGQRRNPLGLTPLAATPRPLLAGNARSGRDTLEVLASYFISEGLLVTLGGEND